MNEDDWLTGTDGTAHARFAAERLSPRRQRLLAVGLCRSAPGLCDHPDLTAALDVIDRYADGRAPAAEVERARWRCRAVAQEAYGAYTASTERAEPSDDEAALLRSELAWVVSFAATSPLPLELVAKKLLDATVPARTGRTEMAPQPADTAALHLVLRGRAWEVAGNPFRPARFSPDWRTGTAVALARQMYDAREFSAMPILADALQDAGCDNEELLAHCRGDGPHGRGCWALDLVLGLE